MSNSIVFNFLDIGMGDCTLVEMPPYGKGPIVLVDCGSHNLTPSNIPYTKALKFLNERITKICQSRSPPSYPEIDHLFISHSDADHWNKLGDLIDSFNPKLCINNLTVGGKWETEYKTKDKATFEKIESVLKNKSNVNLADKQYDMIGNPRWSINGVNIYLLSSNFPSTKNKTNNKSLVLMFEYDGRKVILPGDADSTVEKYIVDEYQKQDPNFLQSIGLKLGHHGSDGSTCDEWIDVVKPKAIFGSADKVWGHPYCPPIMRVMNKGTLDKIGGTHWFICTCPGKDNDYRNISTNLGICNNLWYVVTGADENRIGYDGKQFSGKKGLYTGVQWTLKIDQGKPAEIDHMTDGIWPVPDPNLTPSFCNP
jgi:competence protein ComEC